MANTLEARQVRMVYMLTYSQADFNICDSRQSFANKVSAAFQSVGAQVMQWVCCKENHQDGGDHYHMAIKLDKPRRWIQVKGILENEHGMVINFSSNHANYYTAWQYVRKEDAGVIQSPGHPDLGDNPPATMAASASRVRASGAGSSRAPSKKRKRLTAYDVSEIVVKHQIKTRTELLVLAEKQKQDGKTDLAAFVVNRGEKCVAEAIKVRNMLINQYTKTLMSRSSSS